MIGIARNTHSPAIDNRVVADIKRLRSDHELHRHVAFEFLSLDSLDAACGDDTDGESREKILDSVGIELNRYAVGRGKREC